MILVFSMVLSLLYVRPVDAASYDIILYILEYEVDSEEIAEAKYDSTCKYSNFGCRRNRRR